MYLDAKGLVTTVIGNLIESHGALSGTAKLLDWRVTGIQNNHAAAPESAPKATPAQVEAEFQRIKSHQEMAKNGGGTFQSVATLRLTLLSMDQLFTAVSNTIETNLRKRFPKWESFPADAQLAIMSMAWAMGSGFEFPKFVAACNALDFDTAAEESKINPNIGSIVDRNVQNKIALHNAAHVIRTGGAPSLLLWPQEAGGGGAGPGSGTLAAVAAVGLLLAVIGAVVYTGALRS